MDNPADSSAPPGDSIDFALQNGSSSEPTPDLTTESTTGATSPRPPTLPALQSASEPNSTPSMTASSTHLGLVNNARRPNLPGLSSSARSGLGVASDLQAKMKAFHLSRQGTPPKPVVSATASTGSVPGIPKSPVVGGLPAGLHLPPNIRPPVKGVVSAPAVPKMPSGGLMDRRRKGPPMKLPPAAPAPGTEANGDAPPDTNSGSLFNKYAQYVDTKNGTLQWPGRAVIRGDGIDFANGSNFKISLDEVDTLEELGKGNYGTVYKVRHARPRMRKPGMGLAGNKSSSPVTQSENNDDSENNTPRGNTTGMIMAMKELRLELDEAKFAAIIMELDVLHRCVSPYIIDFYGAFFQEGAVYICIEFMDGGSIDKIYGDGIPENVLRKITYSTTQGLKSLKDEHNIIHRDVKPTNILVNTKGQVKICDFGVSGNLVASIAKTNIGCQSYMAPERISGGGISQAGANPGGGTYSVQSDIWSLGLSIIECAMGRYPYPPETYNNIFSQLSAIVDGEPPDLPEEGFSELARDFVRGCLNKIPNLRPTYSMLLQHGWLAELSKPATISEEAEDEDADGETDEEVAHGTEDKEVAEWVINAMERKRKGLMGTHAVPALHKAPLDTVSPAASPG